MPDLLLYVAVFCGGVLTILSPCILPILPFVFTRRGRPFVQETLPLLAGLVVSFVAVAIVGTAGAARIASNADIGRVVALVARGFAGAALLSPRLATWATRPLVRMGALLAYGQGANMPRDEGKISTGAAAGGRPALAASLFAMFGLGAAFALAAGVAAASGGLQVLRGIFGPRANMWVRRGLGASTLAAVAPRRLNCAARSWS